MMRNQVTTVALRTALLYAGASALWILLSDRLLAFLVSDPVLFSQWSILKGWGFVGVTAALLFFELRRQLRRWATEVARREQAQTHLLQSQNRQLFLAFLIEKSEQPLGIGYPDGRMGLMNRAACDLLGYTASELQRLDWTKDLTPREWHEVESCALAALKPNGRPVRYEKEYIRKNGSRVPVELLVHSGADEAGEQCFYAIVTDITERKRAEAQLRKLSRAVDQSPASIVITDRDGNIEYVNPKFCQITGYTLDEVRGKNPRVLKSGELPADEYRSMWQTITRGEEWRGEFHNRKKNGELFWESAAISAIVDDVGRVTHYLAIKEDITERKRLEEQLRQSQKMDSIGRLAGGVAHDFNNLLAVIQGHTDLLRLFGPLGRQQQESADEIKRATERAASLTRQLLLFSRRQTLQPADLDLNAVVTGITRMLQRILGEDIQMQCHYAPRPLPLRADAGMVDQILLNLAVNSRDAMPGGGQLIIKTTDVTFTDATVAQSPGSRPGDFVCLSVSDTGCGIAPEILPRIFEPFFTTKDVGKGTGLGLATVFGIVQQHHGWINLESTVGRGTTFHIYFPRQSPEAPAGANEIARPSVRGGTETILLVEDDSALRELTRQVLTRLGYHVLEAGSGHEALHPPEPHATEPELLLTDLVMPGGVSGLELAQKLVQQNPRLKVIYTSGYSPDIAGKDVALREGVNFLAKPFDPHKLAQTVRDCLDRD